MSDDLGALLRRSATNGKLNHLSVSATHDGRWEAAYRGVDHKDHRIRSHSDVASAVMMAITGRAIPEPPQRPKRKAVKRAAPLDILEDL